MALSVFMVAGEASADSHGAALLRELKRHVPDLHCFGVGEKGLAREGMEILVDAKAINVVGISDWFDRLGEVVGAYRHVKATVRKRKPDCAILLDLPDFNLRLARQLKAMGVPVIYYISPQVWAWRRYRVKTIRRVVDKMLVLFPFEKAFYDAQGVPAEFVGHPLLETMPPRAHYRSQAEIGAAPRIAALPGSRKSELKFHAPVLRGALERLRKRYPAAEITIPVAPTLAADQVRAVFPDPGIRLHEGKARETLEWADVALVASGTATLETALTGTPFCLLYVLSASSAFLYKRVIRYRGYLGMPNLLHGREVVRELIQQKATPEALAEECSRLIEDEPYRSAMGQALGECREKLGMPGASARAAMQVLSFLRSRAASGKVEGAGLAVPQPT